MLAFYKTQLLSFFTVFFFCFLLLTTPKIFSQTALQFDGTNDYVTFGTASGLGTSAFTLECWVYKTGTGVTASTGTGGVTAVPIITKGRGQAETPANLNMNYFFGVNSTGYLAADFEDKATGGNHPITATTTALSNNIWYHIAATYDGSTWRLFINGNLEATLVVGSFLPENTSIQHAGFGTAMNSTGVREGYFAGQIEEPRIWNYARTQAEIQAGMGQEITSGTGLLGRWGLNDGSGTTAVNSIAGSPNGTLSGTVPLPTWVTGIPFTVETWGLQFNGTSNFVTFGSAAGLATQTFTVETWFKRTGTGSAKSTGSNGITLIPLIAKGSPEADGSVVDANYILGIRSSDNVIAADFEEGTGSAAPGLNHPISGTTIIQNDVWYHAAVTFSSTGELKIFLNGFEEASLSLGVSVWPQGSTTQHSSLGTMLTSTGTTNGGGSSAYFQGVLDEARIWNYARTEAEIQGTSNSKITSSQSGLLARWSLDEGLGSSVNGSAGTTFNGTIQNTGYSWVFGAPYNLSYTPPTAPTVLSATAGSGNQIGLTWTDNASDEIGFQIERSTVSASGPFTLLTTVSPNTTSYLDGNLSLNTTYYYRVRAFKGILFSAFTNVANATTPTEANNALRLNGTSTYVTFGPAPGLATQTFTVETWFKKTGNGTAISSGSGGVIIVPIIAKGSPEQDGSTVDANYILGIQSPGNFVAADFEEGTGSASVGLNHPLVGTTVIQNDIWYHIAVTYNTAGEYRLYLNGNLEGSADLGSSVWPQGASVQHSAVGTMIESDGTSNGLFEGVIDEARIWDYAKTQSEIQSTINSKIGVPTTGLLARWALDEGIGTVINGSAGTSFTGNIINTSYQWVAGAPFNLAFGPVTPLLNSPADGSLVSGDFPTLSVGVSDDNSANLTVRFYGRLVEAGEKFTLIGFPDTQYYSSSLNGGSPAILNSQTQWVVSNKDALNIVYCAGLGDCVEHGDQYEIEWQVFDTAMDYLEDPITTSLPDGIPYGLSVGNHDQTSIGNPDGTTTYFNQYFGVSRFTGRNYYGGGYNGNDNHYDLFNAGGMDFITIFFEYDTSPDADVINWAENLLQTYSNRRAIIASHWIINTGNPGSFGTQGQTLYNAFRDNPNVFLMLCGHVHGEGRRTDTYDGNTIHSILSDYQGRTNGGNGWLRIMEFDPSSNLINVRTYSPYLNQYEQDGDSEFSLSYDMGGVANAPFGELISAIVANNSNASFQWLNLLGDRTYQWYVTVEDAQGNITTGPVWSFTTDAALPVELASFTAKVNRGAVNLNWETNSEVNNYGFEIERNNKQEVTGETWKKIGFVNGNGNSNSPKSYSFIDKTPLGSSKFQYRLKQIDNDGQYEYSDIIEITFTPNEYALYQNYPNPFNPSTKIKFSIKQDNLIVKIYLYSILGEKVATLVNKIYQAGLHEVEFNATNLPSGVYVYKIDVGENGTNFTSVKKMILLK